MLYKEYKLAAEKHLKTCLGIVEAITKLKVSDSSALLVSRNKQAILHNLFYLSGYVLESISTYAVYKHYCWIPNQSVRNYNNAFVLKSNFSFKMNHNGAGNSYYAEYHGFQANQFEVLKTQLNNSGIPMIDSSVIVETDMQILFNLWKPEIRYHEPNKNYPSILNTQISLDESNILKFVDLTNNIYNTIIQTVG